MKLLTLYLDQSWQTFSALCNFLGHCFQLRAFKVPPTELREELKTLENFEICFAKYNIVDTHTSHFTVSPVTFCQQTQHGRVCAILILIHVLSVLI